MCNCFDSGDYLPSFYKETWRKALKVHKCCECLDEIKPGERYQNIFGIWEGEAQEFKTCSSCVDVRHEVYMLTDYWPAFGNAGCCYIDVLREAQN